MQSNRCLPKGSDQKTLAHILLSESEYHARKGANFEDVPVAAAIEFLDLLREKGPDWLPEEIEFFDQGIGFHFLPSDFLRLMSDRLPETLNQGEAIGDCKAGLSRIEGAILDGDESFLLQF